MTQYSESRHEAVMPTPLLKPKRTTKIATRNVRTMYETGKTAQMAREMENYKIPARTMDAVGSDATIINTDGDVFGT